MNNNTAITNVNFEKLLSIIFIIIGVANIFADDIFIKSIVRNDASLRRRADEIFLWALIISFLLYIVIVARAYNFYIEKKRSGQDATSELTRLFGSVLILAGFSIIFYYFIKNNFNTDNTPVL